MIYAHSHCSVYRCFYCIDSTLLELPTEKEIRFLLSLISKMFSSNVLYSFGWCETKQGYGMRNRNFRITIKIVRVILGSWNHSNGNSKAGAECSHSYFITYSILYRTKSLVVTVVLMISARMTKVRYASGSAITVRYSCSKVRYA